MCHSLININCNHEFQDAKDVAKYLGKSLGWVYKHKVELGGTKLGGSWLFPKKEELYELIRKKRQGMEIRFPDEQETIHRIVFQNKNRSKTGSSKKKGGRKKSNEKDSGRNDPNRYGLLDVMQ